MSRAYRIQVRESTRQVVRASDHVAATLELLAILPPDRMAALLAAELRRRGFAPKGGKLVRTEDGVVIEIDPQAATVTLRAESEEQVELKGEREGWADRDGGEAEQQRATDSLRDELRKDLQRQAEARKAALQQQVTERLADVRRELDQAVNRVTADALKERAGQLGQIKEVTEDPQSGSLTIVVEV